MAATASVESEHGGLGYGMTAREQPACGGKHERWDTQAFIDQTSKREVGTDGNMWGQCRHCPVQFIFFAWIVYGPNRVWVALHCEEGGR